MLFNSLIFALFLGVVLPLYYLLGSGPGRLRRQNWLLFLSSYVFYGWWDWRFLFLLVISTVVDFLVGLQLGEANDPKKRLWLLRLSLFVNLGILGFFKYFDFFSASAASALESLGLHANLPLLQIVLPVGISFYTFQTIAYTYSVYKRELEPTRDLLSFAIYVGYFPQLVAGPIERAQHLLPKIQSPRTVTAASFGSGCRLMLQGFLKKIAIADAVAPLVDSAFSNPSEQSSLALLLGVYLFAIQIYGDFSGYTDIARGVSRLFGIELMLNFRQPYLAADITDFWRRWHISLSTWLREHLYIPLGGNRHGSRKTYRNLMLTMLLGGLWHGAGWTFVVWGGLHGLYLAVHKALLSRSPGGFRFLRGRLGAVLGILVTFHLVCFTWIFFRASSFTNARDYLTGLARLDLSIDARLPLNAAFYMSLVLLIDFFCQRRGRETAVSDETPWFMRGLSYAAAVLLILYVGTSNAVPFIYFQF